MRLRLVLSLLRSIVIALASVALVSVAIEALIPGQSQSSSYVVSASVQPARYIIVDGNLQIKEIVSNTAEDVIPYVALSTLDGSQIPYTSSIREQFLSLKASLDFSKAGVVYTRRTGNSLIGAIETAVGDIHRFIFG